MMSGPARQPDLQVRQHYKQPCQQAVPVARIAKPEVHTATVKRRAPRVIGQLDDTTAAGISRSAEAKITRLGDDPQRRTRLASAAAPHISRSPLAETSPPESQPGTPQPTRKESVMLINRGLVTAAGAAVAVTAITVTGVTAASATPRSQPAVSGTEHIQIMSTSTTSNTASAIAYGVFTAAGKAKLGSGRAGTIAFPGGTMRLSHHAGKGTMHFSPKTCLTTISQPGTYKITGGTGRYAGISGHGTYQLSFTFIAARTAGKCSTATAHVAQQELLRLSGPAHL
jgi:hypothetical protein